MNAGERDTPVAGMPSVGPVQSGCAVLEGTRQIPRRESDPIPQTRDDRVQGSTGSINARWRREFPGGDTEEPEADTFRGSAEKADREQLNDERGIKPLPVNHQRDGAESVQPDQGG